MFPEPDLPSASFGLLANGASFSCEVLQALQQQHYLPRLLILPEYPPAQASPHAGREILSNPPQRRLVQQAQDIELGYAPDEHRAVLFVSGLALMTFVLLLVAAQEKLKEVAGVG